MIMGRRILQKIILVNIVTSSGFGVTNSKFIERLSEYLSEDFITLKPLQFLPTHFPSEKERTLLHYNWMIMKVP